MQKHVIHS